MAAFFASLNSGSNGNCYYIGNAEEAILVDAGISCREVEKRMKRLGLRMEVVKAIFVSHEHSDHITGIPALSKKFRLPVYITKATFRSAGIPVEEHLVASFNAEQDIQIGDLCVRAFTKSHDASDPHSFMISCGGINVGVFTDIGNVCATVIRYFKQCHAVFLESNYCPDMLMNGRYPYHLKKRISGGNGHLSNQEALQLFLQHGSTELRHLLLCHLSKNNNDPALVERLFRDKAGNTHITVASRYNETSVFKIEEDGCIPLKQHAMYTQLQLSLFE